MGFKKYKWHKVADRTTDLQWTAGDIAQVEAGGKMICIGRFVAAHSNPDAGNVAQEEGNVAREEWYAFAHTCPHAGAPMLDAYIAGACQVICPVHHLKFNLKNGRDANGEGYTLKTYPVEVRPEGVFVGLEEGGLFKWL